MINWQYYPKSSSAPLLATGIVEVFEAAEPAIGSDSHELNSNAVLQVIKEGLISLGFLVESNKTSEGRVRVPVLFGRNGRMEKCFDADAIHVAEGFVIEVEAGRGVVNNQFLKDLFQACMMHEVYYLAIAVRNVYRTSMDFERVTRFFDTMYASDRLVLPLKGILVIGY